MKVFSLVVAVLCFGIAAYYATGHAQGPEHHTHSKHVVGFVALGILALVFARFQASKPKAMQS